MPTVICMDFGKLSWCNLETGREMEWALVLRAIQHFHHMNLAQCGENAFSDVICAG